MKTIIRFLKGCRNRRRNSRIKLLVESMAAFNSPPSRRS